MTDIDQYTSLKSVVSMALDQVDKSIADFDKCWVLGLRGLTELEFDVSGQPETVQVIVEANKIAYFPKGMLSWSKIGLMNDNGDLNTLRINNAISTYGDNSPNRLEMITSQVNTSVGDLITLPYFTNYYYNGGCYQLYGVGGGLVTYGECKVDEKNRVIIFPPDFNYASVFVEGIMMPTKDNDYQVLTCMREAIIEWILWKLKLGTRQDFYAAAVAGRRRLPKKRFVLQSFNEVIRASESMKLRS